MLMRSEIAPHLFAGLRLGFYCAIAADRGDYLCYSEKGKGRSAEQHYVTMATRKICDLPVAKLAAPDAHLFLWVPAPFVAKGLHVAVMRAWGFAPSAVGFVWVKPTKKGIASGVSILDATLFAMGLGHTTRQKRRIRDAGPTRIAASSEQKGPPGHRRAETPAQSEAQRVLPQGRALLRRPVPRPLRTRASA